MRSRSLSAVRKCIQTGKDCGFLESRVVICTGRYDNVRSGVNYGRYLVGAENIKYNPDCGTFNNDNKTYLPSRMTTLGY